VRARLERIFDPAGRVENAQPTARFAAAKRGLKANETFHGGD
jgi:hypothetical protein